MNNKILYGFWAASLLLLNSLNSNAMENDGKKKKHPDKLPYSEAIRIQKERANWGKDTTQNLQRRFIKEKIIPQKRARLMLDPDALVEEFLRYAAQKGQEQQVAHALWLNAEELPRFQDKKCFVCEERSSSRCGRCQLIYYCSRECQREDWRRHKQHCTKTEVHKENRASCTKSNSEEYK